MRRTKEQVVSLIQQFLIDRNMSVEELATILKVHRGSIYRWMDGSRGISTRHYIQLECLMRGYEPHWTIDMTVEELEKQYF